VGTIGGDYNDEQVLALLSVDDQKVMVGDCVAEYRKYCENQPALAQCMTIRHAQDTAQMFTDAGYKAEAVHGQMAHQDVQEALARLESGETKIVCYAQLLGEGVDIPNVVAMFFLKVTKSLVTWVQACGRVQRRAENKPVAYIFDHFGNANNEFYGHKMGHPSDDRDIIGIIADSLKAKKKASEASEPVYIRCLGCDTAHGSRLKLCPKCGYDRFEAQEKEKEQQRIEGELKEYERNQDIVRIRKEIATLSSYEDYQAYAKLKGYKSGWAYHAWKNSWKSKKTNGQASGA
ncbi:MAG: hypothetical protein F2563_02390, partial [Actinobacteria bacterium]|nr:hypothetical protein [Actinomycetota bacterium]